jgi:uncharacterized protein YigE (DUF2233 family)
MWMLVPLCASAPADAAPIDQTHVEHLGDGYTVVTVDLTAAELRMFGGAGGISMSEAKVAAERSGASAQALMNGGMYGHDDGPIGLFVLDGQVRHALNTKEGAGNFHLMPNGVFYVDVGGKAHVDVTATVAALDLATVRDATQSGPMLLIDGAVHPEFRPESTNKLPRNGVGVSPDGNTVYLVISDGSVRFHDFATMFRDELHCEDALFLDGVVSLLWNGTAEQGASVRFGVVITASVPAPAASPAPELRGKGANRRRHERGSR